MVYSGFSLAVRVGSNFQTKTGKLQKSNGVYVKIIGWTQVRIEITQTAAANWSACSVWVSLREGGSVVQL